MPKPWTHPTLGQFEANRVGWFRTVNVPAFKAFSYDTGYPNARRSNGKYSLFFLWWTGEAPDVPTPEMAAVAERVLAEPRELVKTVVAALWDEFNGRGPDSGMWWRGGMDAVRTAFKNAKLPPLRRPDDLLPSMQLHSINVCSEVFDYPRPVADLTFRAAFEKEHGVSVLTDGDQVLGLGHANDVYPWKHLRPKRKPAPNPFAPKAHRRRRK